MDVAGVFKERQVMLGVSGGVSAYKAVEVLRLLVKAGARVDVVLTKSATNFVSAATFRALSGRPVLVDLFEPPEDFPAEDRTMPHLAVAERAELVIVAPATANTLARMAHGLADNALVTALLSVRAPVIVAPAMDSDMWLHPATQQNVATLKARGVHVVGPEVGALARLNVGPGRLSDPARIVEEAAAVLAGATRVPPKKGSLSGKRLIVTAGGTREVLDPVRFIGNRSSGKMGYAIAAAALERGAAVTLITAPTGLEPPAGAEVVRVVSALEMKEAVEGRLGEADAVVMAAAVADYRPERVEPQKVKKHAETWQVTLVRNPDIAAGVGARKRKDQVLVIFAAETENLMEHAQRKLEEKRADFIVANDVGRLDVGFESDENEVTLLFADGRRELVTKRSKAAVAEIVVERVSELLGRAHGRAKAGE